MFLLSNLALPFCEIAYFEYYKTSSSVWLGMYSLCLAIVYGLANIAHWSFSFEYYNMVRIIPFVLDDMPPSKSIIN